MEEESCHPALLLEDILEVLFKKLPLEELKTCRQVCRKWEEASRDLVKNQSALRLKISGGDFMHMYEVKDFLRQDFHFMMPFSLKIEISGEDLREELVENYSDIIERKVYEGDKDKATKILWKLKRISPEYEMEEFEELLLAISKNITGRRWIMEHYIRLNEELEDICGILGQGQLSFEELQIYGIELPSFPEGYLHHMLNILGRLSKSVKSLKTCSIPGDSSNGKQMVETCSLLTKLSLESAPEWFHNRIFSACPNITEVNGNSYCNLAVLQNICGGLKKILGFRCFAKDDLEILKSKSGELEELSLELEVREESVGESVLEFLQSKSESLANIELKFWDKEELRLGQGFIRLTKLDLQKMCYVNGQKKQFILDVCFSKDTPQLKYFKLELPSAEPVWKNFLAYRRNIVNGGRVAPLRSLTHLDLQMEGLEDRECANYLRMLFPSLTSFKMKRPTEDFLRGIWQMENLVELHMNMEIYYGEEECIEDLGVVLFGTQQDQENGESILNLKKLRSLCIIKRVWKNRRNWIPDKVVHIGFGNMKRLAVLNLPRFKMTPEAIGYLRANLPYLKKLTSDAY